MEIHKAPCKHCPSKVDNKRGIVDKMSEEIKENCTKQEIVKNFLFPCYCRKNKICKGISDYYGVTEEMITK